MVAMVTGISSNGMGMLGDMLFVSIGAVECRLDAHRAPNTCAHLHSQRLATIHSVHSHRQSGSLSQHPARVKQPTNANIALVTAIGTQMRCTTYPAPAASSGSMCSSPGLPASPAPVTSAAGLYSDVDNCRQTNRQGTTGGLLEADWRVMAIKWPASWCSGRQSTRPIAQQASQPASQPASAHLTCPLPGSTPATSSRQCHTQQAHLQYHP